MTQANITSPLLLMKARVNNFSSYELAKSYMGKAGRVVNVFVNDGTTWVCVLSDGQTIEVPASCCYFEERY